MMDCLKTKALFWKKETRPDGVLRWLDARQNDTTWLTDGANGRQLLVAID